MVKKIISKIFSKKERNSSMKKAKEVKSCSSCKYANTMEHYIMGEDKPYITYKCTLQNNRIIYSSSENDKECELSLYEHK